MPKRLTSEETERLEHLKTLQTTYRHNVYQYEMAVANYGGESLKELATIIGHTEAVRSVAWSPDGTTLVSASDETVRLRGVPK